ncbi:MAG TPA: hypothetical protein VG015_04710 [Candidatus Dormibacteraeota bacterium]|jgi:hypothetical protein|nr:hypothetical protein [Candidatus Dormibacteraeota bacterium]
MKSSRVVRRLGPQARLQAPPIQIAISLVVTGLVGGLYTLVWSSNWPGKVRFTDFAQLWVGARLAEQEGLMAVYTDRYPQALSRFGVIHALYRYPPWTSLAFNQTFGRMGILVGYELCTGLILASMILAWALLVKGTGWERAAHLIAFLALPMVGFELWLANLVGFEFALITVVWWLAVRRKDWIAGLVLGFCLLKPQSVILVAATLLVAGRPKIALAWAGFVACLGLITLRSVGWQGVSTYQSILGQDAGNLTWIGHSLMAHIPYSERAVAQAMVIIATLVGAYRLRGLDPGVAIALGILGSAALTPYFNIEDLSLAVLAGWLMLRVEWKTWVSVLLVLSYVGLMLLRLSEPFPWPWFATELTWLGLACWGLPGALNPTINVAGTVQRPDPAAA